MTNIGIGRFDENFTLQNSGLTSYLCKLSHLPRSLEEIEILILPILRFTAHKMTLYQEDVVETIVTIVCH